MSQPIRKQESDVMVTKMRLDDVIKVIKAPVSMTTLILSQAVEEATPPARNLCHRMSSSQYVTLLTHQHHQDGMYEPPDYYHEEKNKM